MRSGQRIPTRLLDARRMDSEHGFARVALLVPKYGFTVARRNQLKRRLRELVRRELLPQPCSCDLLLRARREAYHAPFDGLREDVHRVVHQLSR